MPEYMADTPEIGTRQNMTEFSDGISYGLDMMQLSDSMFPTGMFASSGGLELMFERGMVTDAVHLAGLCRDMIERQVGTTDCIALAMAHDAAARHDMDGMMKADAACCSMKTVPEARDAAIRSGVQLCRCVAAFYNDEDGSGMITVYLEAIRSKEASGVYPVSLGICCQALGIRKEAAAQMLLYGFASSMTSAALRLGMIQHVEAQCIIHALKPAIREAAAASMSATDVSDMWQFCPHAEILQMAHARMDSKMFIT